MRRRTKLSAFFWADLGAKLLTPKLQAFRIRRTTKNIKIQICNCFFVGSVFFFCRSSFKLHTLLGAYLRSKLLIPIPQSRGIRISTQNIAVQINNTRKFSRLVLRQIVSDVVAVLVVWVVFQVVGNSGLKVPVECLRR